VHGSRDCAGTGRDLTTNGQASTVTIFDLKTLQEDGDAAHREEAGRDNLYDPATSQVFAFNRGERQPQNRNFPAARWQGMRELLRSAEARNSQPPTARDTSTTIVEDKAKF